eukprot:15476977-Alexandrium_andersonii.AAC.1
MHPCTRLGRGPRPPRSAPPATTSLSRGGGCGPPSLRRAGCQLPIAARRLPFAAGGLPIADHRLLKGDFASRIA